MEIVVRCALVDWTPTGTFQGLVAKYDGPSGSGRSYYFRVNGSTQKLEFGWLDSGTATSRNLQSTANVPFSDGSMGWVKVEFDADNGSSQVAAKFYTAADQATEPTVWTQLGSTVVLATVAAIDVGTFPVVIGSENTSSRVSSGTFSRAIIRDGIGGTVVFDADFENEAADTLAFTEDSTNAATVSVVTTRYTIGLPGVSFSGVTTVSVTPNTDFYYPFVVTQPVEFDMYTVEVTTGPASAATAYLGIYPTDGDYNPNGNVIAATSFAVGTSETGVFQTQVSPVTLQPGTYVAVLNTSVAFTGRALSASRTNVVHTFGSSPFTLLLYRNRTAATMPTTLSGPDLRVTSSATQRIPMLLRWRPL